MRKARTLKDAPKGARRLMPLGPRSAPQVFRRLEAGREQSRRLASCGAHSCAPRGARYQRPRAPSAHMERLHTDQALVGSTGRRHRRRRDAGRSGGDANCSGDRPRISTPAPSGRRPGAVRSPFATPAPPGTDRACGPGQAAISAPAIDPTGQLADEVGLSWLPGGGQSVSRGR